MFFAAIWGVIFKLFVLKDTGKWILPTIALFFTGIPGIFLLLKLYGILPESYIEMSSSNNKVVSLLGFILQVGICEELLKALPVFAYVLWKRSKSEPMTILLVGIFSGLGFAAFENLMYGRSAVAKSLQLTSSYGIAGLKAGVQGAMILTMLRSLSLVFCHAVWSGILAYFLATAWASKRRAGALLIVGLVTSATLHGVYNWFCGVQSTIAAIIAGFSFMLFYAYATKLRAMMEDTDTNGTA